MSIPRTLAIGDIHGCHAAFQALLELIQPETHDTVVLLGDLVDRGPDSNRVMEAVLGLRQRCQLIAIMGNHDEIFVNSYNGGDWHDTWLEWGGTSTLESYGGQLSLVPSVHIEFLDSMLPYWETSTEIFVHATADPLVAMPNQSVQALRWDKINADFPQHMSGKRLVCGHTSQKKGTPLVFPGGVCIDTYACGGQWLSCLDVENDEIVQVSTDRGSRRLLRLDPLSDKGWSKLKHGDAGG